MSKVFLFFMIVSIITLVLNVVRFSQYYDLAYIVSGALSFVLIIVNIIWYAEYRDLD